MTQICLLVLSLLLTACSSPLNERLIPRYAIDASGAAVPLGTYFDKITQRTCSPRNTPTGVRCVTEVNYGPVLYRTPTCSGPALTDPFYFVDEYLHAANRDDGALYEACRTPDPALNPDGPWFKMLRPDRCASVEDAVNVTTHIQVCPVDLAQFPLLNP
jgi:hypothetical protein